ncbi:hypothetical protein ZWY2020_031170 [Hordeum vulgare]|nr:hypothetical protein ZWY2020_031170 [Hordeum vulgare]
MAKAGKHTASSSSFVASLLYLTITVLLSSRCKSVDSTDTLLPGQSLSGNQSLVSKYGSFRLGFDSNSALGIWYMNSSTCNPPLVWSPDVDFPDYTYTTSRYSLGLSEDGNLYLKNDVRSVVWSLGMDGITISAVAVLLDNGNLVVRDQVNISLVSWQSFDNPVGALLPGGWLGFNRINNKNVSLVSTAYYYSRWMLKVNAEQSRGFTVQDTVAAYSVNYFDVFPSWMDIHEEDGGSLLLFNDAHLYIQLHDDGTVSAAKLGDCRPVLWSPYSRCGYTAYCGPDSICVVSNDAPRSYCLRVAAPHCLSNLSSKQETSFHPIDEVSLLPASSSLVQVRDIKECEAICSSNCSCTSYAFKEICSLWFVELHKLTVVTKSGSDGHLYVRTSTAKQNEKSSKNEILISTVTGVLLLLLVALVLSWRSRRKIFTQRLENCSGGLTIFSDAQMKKATRNFSEKLGEGGFGCVFKGTLPAGSSMVAVKKLKDLGLGEKQFRAEVQTIGMIQHINLVRLFGFCAERGMRMLVYEYMENGSLNSHLFSKGSSKLAWELRYRIALGTARGLAYLHEGCTDCIIHCDMKPDNVLLDADFCPKIADFGMAKVLGRDFSRALTTMRGTIGYLAPEWISGVPITHKSDVYSYGMMLLEIISGRRNSEKIKEGEFTYFPIFAAVKVHEGDVVCLLDSRLEGDAVVEQLSRACRTACWCIQDDEDHRPMMGQVVHMLEGVVDVHVPPIPRSLQNFVGMDDCSHSTAFYNL